MKFKDLLKMAKENLFRRKLRTSLTILSIVIGTISIVLMISLGMGIQEGVKKEFSSFGSVNILNVSKTQVASKTTRINETSKTSGLTDDDVTDLSSIKGVDVVVPILQTSAKLVSSQYESIVQVIGYDPAYMEVMGFKVKEGSLLKDNFHNDILFGDKARESFTRIKSDNPNAELQRRSQADNTTTNQVDYYSEGQMYDNEGGSVNNQMNPLIERFKMTLNVDEEKKGGMEKIYSFNGVGIILAGDSDKDYNVYVPIQILEKLIKEYNEDRNTAYVKSYSSIQVRVSDLDQIKTIQRKIEAKGYSVFSLMNMLSSINKTMGILQVALGAIGGISLFVAAIGITNTMVMAITERKKEIGIMKVIGATIKDIKRLFLIESALIGLIGGIFGITLCIGISKLISTSVFSDMLGGGASFSFAIPTWLILSGLVFTTAIGIISGFFPALKAMRSSALEAIRTE